MALAQADTSTGLRRLALALLTFGLIGLSIELVFLEHYEDGWMLIPLVVIAAALLTLVLVSTAPSAGGIWLFRGAMGLMLVSGALGVWLHYRVGLEFQADMDPTLSAGQLFWKVLHMKAPPMLAPGMMAQFGLLGLIATYRHPALQRGVPVPTTGVYS